MSAWIYVAIGAATGASLRYLLGRRLDRRLPWGTVLVNVAGSFVLGLLSALAVSVEAASLVGTGFCGGLTTYSAFAVQTAERGTRLGAITVLLTLPPALLACALGFALGGLGGLGS